MINTLLKQSIDALILRTGYKTVPLGLPPICVYLHEYALEHSVLCSEYLCYTISSTVGLIASIFQQVCSILWATCICLSKY